MKLISISTQKDFCEQETYRSVPFLPTNFSFQEHYPNSKTTFSGQDHSKLDSGLKRNVYVET